MRTLVLVLVAACRYEHGTPVDLGDGQVDAPDDVMPPPEVISPCAAAAELRCTNPVTVKFDECNGACWAKCQSYNPITQSQADAACTEWGGKLAPIRDTADQHCVSNVIWPGDAHWIGFEQALTASETNTDWSWNGDLIPVTFDVWDNGQPDDNLGSEANHEEQCAMMNTQKFWHDVPCNGQLYRFSCRRN